MNQDSHTEGDKGEGSEDLLSAFADLLRAVSKLIRHDRLDESDQATEVSARATRFFMNLPRPSKEDDENTLALKRSFVRQKMLEEEVELYLKSLEKVSSNPLYQSLWRMAREVHAGLLRAKP